MPKISWPARTWRRLALGTLALGVAATLLCLALVASAMRDDHAIATRTGTATAEVIATSFSRTLVRFATPDGRVHSPHDGLLYPAGLKIHDQVRIEYDTNNPDLATVAGRGATLTFLPMGTTILIVWLVLLPVAYYFRRRSRTLGFITDPAT